MGFEVEIPAGWKKVRLSELGEINRGKSRHRPRDAAHLYGGEYPFVQTGDIKASNGRINRFEQTYSEAGLAQSRLWPKGTMCITIAATIAETGILQFPACFPDSVIGFIADSSKCNVYFIEYMFRLLRRKIQKEATGSVQDNINIQTLENLYFPLPPLDEQDRIASILCSYDDKIELNRQTNQTLEQIAQALFKSWFVDFEPTRAKIAAKEAGASPEEIERAAMCAISGKTPAQLTQLPPETQQNLKTTAALFPDALVDSELGEIPEGWEVSNLKSVTTEIRRGISPAYVDENGVCVINQKCIRNHKIDFSFSRLNDPIKKKVEDRLLQVGDVLVNSTGVGTLGRLAPIRYLFAPTVHDSHVTVVRADTNEISNSFLIGLMLENETFIEASGIGSTGQTELNRQVLENISFAKPTLALSLLFESIVEPMNRQIAIYERQESSLAVTRDTLLPKLLSGDVEAIHVN